MHGALQKAGARAEVYMRTLIISTVLTLAGTMSVTTSGFPAELQIPQSVPRAGHVTSACGPCGRLRVSYVYHRDLRTTYGTGFDPRNFDQTQPYFYPGHMHAYPRYWVELCGEWAD
jgi:hypothetical protein